MLSGVDERIEKVPRHVCLAFNNGLTSDIAASRFRVFADIRVLRRDVRSSPESGHC